VQQHKDLKRHRKGTGVQEEKDRKKGSYAPREVHRGKGNGTNTYLSLGARRRASAVGRELSTEKD